MEPLIGHTCKAVPPLGDLRGDSAFRQLRLRRLQDRFRSRDHHHIPGGVTLLRLNVSSDAVGLVGVIAELDNPHRSEEHTSELQPLMRSSSAVFCLKKQKIHLHTSTQIQTNYNNLSH